MDELSTRDIAKEMAPFLILTALVAFLASVLFFKFALPLIAPGAGAPTVVTFDVVRYANAQRAVASAFLRKEADQVAASEMLTGLPERTRKAIAEVAGGGALVVMKQAVVQGETRDITEDVLKKLGMPVNVPTSDGVAYTLDVAPTMLMRVPSARNPIPLEGEGVAGPGVLP